jgi:hypothetical protein
MTSEPETIKALLEQLVAAPLHAFTEPAPAQCGVYAIYDATGACVHVGQGGTRARGSLRGRLRRHAAGRTSFVRLYYVRDRAKLRDHQVRWLVVDDPRQRWLLEHLAVGVLCPKHVHLQRAADAAALEPILP